MASCIAHPSAGGIATFTRAAGEKGKFYPRRAHTEGKMVCAPPRRVILAAR